jgi:hypothetical protein
VNVSLDQAKDLLKNLGALAKDIEDGWKRPTRSHESLIERAPLAK